MVDTRFFDSIGEIKLVALLEAIGVDVSNCESDKLTNRINGAAPLESANQFQIGLASHKKYVSTLSKTEAGAVFVSEKLAQDVPNCSLAVVCQNPHLDFVKALEYLFPKSGHRLSHSPHVTSMPKPELEDDVKIGSNAVIGSGVQIGQGSIIGPNTVISAGVTIGRNTIIADNVTIECSLIGDDVVIHSGARIGTAGFGWLDFAKTNRAIPQLGRVILQAKVEVGANTSIDRGALGDTIIGENTKIGAQVEIGHNCILGRNCLLAPKCGLAGGTILEDGVLLGADAASSGHLTIGSGSILHARSAASKSWPSGSMLAGAPAKDIKEYWRELATLRKLTKG